MQFQIAFRQASLKIILEALASCSAAVFVMWPADAALHAEE
jgi:hypothetical protein